MENEIQSISVDLLKPNELSPRSVDDAAIEQLSRNIQKVGLLQNLVVTPNKQRPGFYTIIVGEQRWRAAQRNGGRELPCRVIEHATEEDQILMMLSENQLRMGFTAAQTGQLVGRLEAVGWTLAKTSEHLGLSEGTLKRWIKLEKKATPKTKAALAPADSKRVPKGKIGTEAGEIITELPVPDEVKDRLVDQQIIKRQPVETLKLLSHFAPGDLLVPAVAFDKAAALRGQRQIQAAFEGGKIHRNLVDTSSAFLSSIGYDIEIALDIAGTKPDVTGMKEGEVIFVECETLKKLRNRAKPRVAGYPQVHILALPIIFLQRYHQIWFIDHELKVIAARVRGKEK